MFDASKLFNILKPISTQIILILLWISFYFHMKSTLTRIIVTMRTMLYT